jgi:DNA repair photolyase
MAPLHKVSIKRGDCSSLNSQSSESIYPYGFPFTLNPTMGCSFGCKFCYSAIFLRQNIKGKNREHFFNESTIRMDIAHSLDKDLTRLSPLPQHLKRVQINETSDYYLSEVLSELETQGRDVMLEILQVFQDHWNNGNKWMLHILTKSHLIEKHLDKLKEMKEMIQIEMSFSTPHETQLRELELYTPTIKKRLETIEKLSKEGIFVRVMAMPFYGGVPELDELKKITFNAGARALKNKALNYFEWDDVKNISFEDLVQYKLPQTGSRKDTIISSAHTIKSGEDYLENGKTESVDIQMPSEKAWDAMSKFRERTSLRTFNKIDMGYDELNDIDWGYIKSK